MIFFYQYGILLEIADIFLYFDRKKNVVGRVQMRLQKRVRRRVQMRVQRRVMGMREM